MNSPVRSALLSRLLLLLWLFGPLSVHAQQDSSSPPRGVEWGWQGEVLFQINRASLQSDDFAFLDRIARLMKDRSGVSVLLTGRADNTGEAGSNQALSMRRTEAVERYLIRRGVDRYRIAKRSVGEGRPVASNVCAEDRRRNRRVDLAFFPTGQLPPPPTETSPGDSAPDPGREREDCR